jgi:hypothetical protein
VPVTATNFAISLKKFRGVAENAASRRHYPTKQGSPILEGLMHAVITLMYLLLATHHGTGWPY